MFDDEREEAVRSGYSVFGAGDVMGILEDARWRETHDFVRDYVDHVAGLVRSRQQALEDWCLDLDYVQWEFMVALREAIGPPGTRLPGRSFNLGGGAWTQYPHYEQRSALFWRLDSGMPLRLMVDTNVVGGEKALAEWDRWDRTFRDAVERCGMEPGPFRRVRSRNGHAVAEGTIGAVSVRDCLRRQGVGECIGSVREMHRYFVRETGLDQRDSRASKAEVKGNPRYGQNSFAGDGHSPGRGAAFRKPLTSHCRAHR